MNLDRIRNFKEHSIFMSEIAHNLLQGNYAILETPGVREIISLYMLIPYATRSQLDKGEHFIMPKLDIEKEFLHGVKLEDLRNTISHSFVTVEESTPEKNGRIIIDDRAQMGRKEHEAQEVKSLNVNFEINELNNKLKELHKEVIESI
ncbi:hypothetical protein [Tenacibaculum aiptasiae]|uniref:hypothetical protein n=1 Tax=Tenacibaculum aiptasiae TaxID=426481 RepID=UPI00232D1292|nr:hypothetical protein [Tenacibaculum aiptasiae]